MRGLDILLWITTSVFIANVVLVATVIFFERRNPVSTWAWIFVLSFMPVVGFVIYLLFGRNSSTQKVFMDKMQNDEKILFDYVENDYKLSREVERQVFSNDGISLGQEYQNLKDFATLNIKAGSWLCYNNSVTYFNDGKKKFITLIEDIRNAKKFIHLQYYIIRWDELGKQIFIELAKKAAEGVEIRILYDFMGNRHLKKKFFEPLILAGGEVEYFHIPRFLSINCRNHRKVVVIDGNIGYIGGFNIGNEYLGKVKKYGKWRDTHVRFCGEVVNQLQLHFLMDWNHSSKDRAIKINDFYLPQVDKVYGHLPAQIVCSGPDTQWKNVKYSYFKMITEAEKTIFIETPYFIPEDDISTALKVAALAGIDVRIIIPGKPDHPFVYWASMSYLGELLEAGVKCYQYETGFIHSKTVFIDGVVASVGTANMDVRSFGINFEINSLIYDPETIKMLEVDFFNDLKECSVITKEIYAKRGKMFKLKESISRLISPML